MATTEHVRAAEGDGEPARAGAGSKQSIAHLPATTRTAVGRGPTTSSAAPDHH